MPSSRRLDGAITVPGLLGALVAQQPWFSSVPNSEDMRRRRAGLLTAPPIYYDQERTF